MMNPWRSLCTRTTATREPICRESRQGILLLRVSTWVLSTSVYTTKRNIFLKNFCSWTELHLFVTIIQCCRSLWLTFLLLFWLWLWIDKLFLTILYISWYHLGRIGGGKCCHRSCSAENSALHKKVTFRFIRSSVM